MNTLNIVKAIDSKASTPHLKSLLKPRRIRRQEERDRLKAAKIQQK